MDLTKKKSHLCLSLTDDGLFKGGIHRYDVLLHQLHWARSLGDLLIQVIGKSGPLQPHLCGL